jgi:preprotein translocase subunit YajC
MTWSQLKQNSLATETQKGLVLAVCLVVMSGMCVALIWQAQVIAEQRENIKWLQSLKLGG